MRKQRDNNFDFLRFFFAALVVFSHSFPISGWGNQREPLWIFTKGQATFGELAVDAFFIISGYLITASWISLPNVALFLRKRILRIIPAFVLVVLIGYAVLIPLNMPEPNMLLDKHELGNLGRGLLTLKGYEHAATFPHNPRHGLNGSLWSISYEAWCYVGVMLLGLIGWLRRRRVALTVFIVSLVVAFLFAYFDFNPGGKILGRIFGWPKLWSRMLPFYMAGVVGYLYRDRIRFTPLLAVCAIGLLLGSARLPSTYSFVLPVCLAVVIFWFAFSPSIHLTKWAKYGDFSYGMYLWGFPVQQVLTALLGPLNPAVLCCTALLISVALGAMSWHLVEKHALALARSPRQPTPRVAMANNA